MLGGCSLKLPPEEAVFDGSRDEVLKQLFPPLLVSGGALAVPQGAVLGPQQLPSLLLGPRVTALRVLAVQV